MKRVPIRAVVRVRPHEAGGCDPCVAKTGACSIALLPPRATASGAQAQSKTFTLDAVFDGGTQEELFEEARPLVCDAIDGYNATIFAFGCTGSGKTHTMSGPRSAPGIMPRAVSLIFSEVQRRAQLDESAAFLVRVSFVELYNNSFRDLLSSRSGSTASAPSEVRIREGAQGPHLVGSSSLRTPVRSAKEALGLIVRGIKNRATGRTNLNDHSSRSHAIVTIEVEGREHKTQRLVDEHAGTDSDSDSDSGESDSEVPQKRSTRSHSGAKAPASSQVTTLGMLHLVDLAGSERLALSGSSGDAMTETQNINLSLTTLCEVLSRLAKNAVAQDKGKSKAKGKAKGKANGKKKGKSNAREFIPYRDSKLTFLLKDSLGGNAKTLMITTVRTGLPHSHVEASMALHYASRARHIRNRATVRFEDGANSAISVAYSDFERLQRQLRERSIAFDTLQRRVTSSEGERQDMARKIRELRAQNSEEQKEASRVLNSVIRSTKGELSQREQAFEQLQDRLDSAEAHRRQQAQQIESLQGEVRRNQENLKRGIEKQEVQEAKEASKLRHAERQLCELRTEHEALQRDAAAESERNHNRQIELEEEIGSLRAREQSLVGALKQTRALAAEAATRDRVSLRGGGPQLEERCQRAEKERDNAVAENKRKRREVQKLCTVVESLQAKVERRDAESSPASSSTPAQSAAASASAASTAASVAALQAAQTAATYVRIVRSLQDQHEVQFLRMQRDLVTKLRVQGTQIDENTRAADELRQSAKSASVAMKAQLQEQLTMTRAAERRVAEERGRRKELEGQLDITRQKYDAMLSEAQVQRETERQSLSQVRDKLTLQLQNITTESENAKAKVASQGEKHARQIDEMHVAAKAASRAAKSQAETLLAEKRAAAAQYAEEKGRRTETERQLQAARRQFEDMTNASRAQHKVELDTASRQVEKLTKLVEQRDSLLQKTKKGVKSRDSALEQAVRERNELSARLQNITAELHDAVADSRSQAEEHAQTAAGLRAEALAAEERLAEEQSRCQELDQKFDAAQLRAEERLAEEQSRCQDLEQKFDAAQLRFTEASDAARARHKVDVADAAQQMDELAEQLKQAEEARDAFRVEVQERADAAEAAARRFEQVEEALRKDIVIAQGVTQKQRNEFEEALGRAAIVQEDKDEEKRTLLRDLAQAREDLARSKTMHCAARAALERDLEQSREDVGKACAAATAANNKLKTLEKARDSLLDQLAAAEARAHEATSKSDTELKHLRDSLRAADLRATNAEASNAELRVDAKDRDLLVGSLQQHKVELQDRLQQAEEQHEQYSAELKQAADLADSRACEVERLANAMHEQQAHARDSEFSRAQEHIRLERSLEDASREIESQTKDAERQRAKVRRLETRNAELSQKVTALAGDMTKLREQTRHDTEKLMAMFRERLGVMSRDSLPPAPPLALRVDLDATKDGNGAVIPTATTAAMEAVGGEGMGRGGALA